MEMEKEIKQLKKETKQLKKEIKELLKIIKKHFDFLSSRILSNEDSIDICLDLIIKLASIETTPDETTRKKINEIVEAINIISRNMKKEKDAMNKEKAKLLN